MTRLIVFFVFVCYVQCLPNSCKDIYIASGKHSANGTYQIYNHQNQAYPVYCEFHDNFGYTYVSRKANVEVNINNLYTVREHAKIRTRETNMHQTETIVENLARYKSQYPLSFFYNRNDGYATPVNYAQLKPYLYLGFLPQNVANHVQPQGYRAGGKDFQFTNCDGNPNSYMAFFFNPHNHSESNYFLNFPNVPLMHKWIDVSHDIPAAYHMPEEFFFLYEMHMGGCGGYGTSHHYNNVLGAALGMRFELTDPCSSQPCMNGGSCFSESETLFSCECPVGWLGVHCEIDLSQQIIG